MSADFDRFLDRDADQEAAIQRWDGATAYSALMRAVQRYDILSAKKTQAVFSGEYEGREVILRHIVRPNAAELVAQMQAELVRVGTKMRAGDYRINQLIAADPQVGLMIVSKVPGVPFREAYEQAPERLMVSAGRWHSTYVGTHRSAGHLSPMNWHTRLSDLPRNGLDGPDMALATDLRQALRGQVNDLRGRDICRVIGHGDFAPHNLRFADGVLYGFDAGKGAQIPLARELAHFLLHVALKNTGSGSVWGIEQQEVDVFVAASGLPRAEIDSTLRYFFGWYLYRSILRYARNAARRARLRLLIKAYLGAA